MLTHNVWVLDWQLIITLIGWGAIVRAVVTIFEPQWIVVMGTKLLEHRELFLGAAVVDLIIGSLLSYFGYFT